MCHRITRPYLQGTSCPNPTRRAPPSSLQELSKLHKPGRTLTQAQAMRMATSLRAGHSQPDPTLMRTPTQQNNREGTQPKLSRPMPHSRHPRPRDLQNTSSNTEETAKRARKASPCRCTCHWHLHRAPCALSLEDVDLRLRPPTTLFSWERGRRLAPERMHRTGGFHFAMSLSSHIFCIAYMHVWLETVRQRYSACLLHFAYALQLSCPDGVSLESNRDLNECMAEGMLLDWQPVVPHAKLLPPAIRCRATP
jgi:hypothetical protein